MTFCLAWPPAEAWSSTGQDGRDSLRPIFDERFDLWPVQLRSPGRVIVHCEVTNFEPHRNFLERLTKESRVCAFALATDPLLAEIEGLSKQETPVAQGHELPQLKLALAGADTVYVSGAAFGTEEISGLADEFRAFLGRGGNLIFDGDLGGMLGALPPAPSKTKSLALIPDCCIDCTFDGGESATKALVDHVSKSPRILGIGVEPRAMLVLRGRTLSVMGAGSMTALVPGNAAGPPITRKLTSARGRQRTNRIDLTQWRRMAIDQSVEPFPPAAPRTPLVEKGTLYIVGGGGTPRGLMSAMIEKAGGLEEAKLVYIPCAESDDVDDRQGTVEMWKRMGVKHATFIHTKDRNQANTDEAILGPLRDATMLWFGGGRQWNFADSYYGTKAHELMKGVLHRGGVIGGSSAGASIQGRFLARATPIGNSSILAPGYERGGLGFLSGVAIDQHFSQRGRQKDMTQLVRKYPQLLGIGIDEATAIVVEESRATVLGNGKVYFYDAAADRKKGLPDYEALPAGSVYDLASRRTLDD